MFVCIIQWITSVLYFTENESKSKKKFSTMKNKITAIKSGLFHILWKTIIQQMNNFIHNPQKIVENFFKNVENLNKP